ncbi:putative E3 ubiquitin-protein ligase RZF1-like [Cocos nucifera]|nr:putative E3 ubiquitin-protein ligase RZF1-like [Cocos nucifera]
MVEVRFFVSRSRIHQPGRIVQVERQPNVFRFHLPLSGLFPHRLRRLQVEYMLSHVGHPHRTDVDFWTDQISSYTFRAANAVVLEGYSGFLMAVYLHISAEVTSVSAHARMEDGVLMLDESFGELMLSLEEEAGGTGQFGFVPTSESSIKTLGTKTYQGDGQDGPMCSICLEIFEAGAELIGLPCSHEFHRSCATKWLERSHLCPLCRYPMPTVHGEGATA